MTLWEVYRSYTRLRRRAEAGGVPAPSLTNERYYEYAWVLRHLGVRPGMKVLDVGSSNSLTPCLLAKRYGAVVHAVDPHEHVMVQRTYADWCGLDGADDGPGGRVIVEIQDATRLSYSDDSFDAATCISTIEHIPDDGDRRALNELVRVIRPGGLIGLTVPFHVAYREIYLQKDVYSERYEGNPIFFERHYDRQALMTRLLSHPRLEVLTSSFLVEWRQLRWYLKIARECLPDVGLRSLFEARVKWREVPGEPTHLNDASLCKDPQHPHADFLCILRKNVEDAHRD